MHQTGCAPVIDNAGALVTIYVPSWCHNHRQCTKLVLQLQTRYQAGVAVMSVTDNQYQVGGAAVTDNVPSTFQGGQRKTPRGCVWDQLEDSSSLKLKLLIIVCVVTSS